MSTFTSICVSLVIMSCTALILIPVILIISWWQDRMQWESWSESKANICRITDITLVLLYYCSRSVFSVSFIFLLHFRTTHAKNKTARDSFSSKTRPWDKEMNWEAVRLHNKEICVISISMWDWFCGSISPSFPVISFNLISWWLLAFSLKVVVTLIFLYWSHSRVNNGLPWECAQHLVSVESLHM